MAGSVFITLPAIAISCSTRTIAEPFARKVPANKSSPAIPARVDYLSLPANYIYLHPTTLT
jgi:hypothetical protein